MWCRISMNTHYTSRPARARSFRTKERFRARFPWQLELSRDWLGQLAKRQLTIGMSLIRDES